MPTAPEIEQAIVALLGQRSPDSSICPSEVARAIGEADAWRELMAPVHEVAARMATQRRITISRRGVEVKPEDWGAGPVRLHRGDRFKS